MEGVGSVEGVCTPHAVGGLGACPGKKINFALKLCISEQVLVLLSYITAESRGGDYPPVLKVGDLSPCPTAPTPVSSDLPHNEKS